MTTAGTTTELGGRVQDEDFDDWYRSESPRMVGVLHAAVGDRALAEDAVAEAFARAWSDWRKVRSMERRTGWVYRVALNLCRSSFRRRRLERRHLDRSAPAPEVAAPEPGDDQLLVALDGLSDRARTAVVLRYAADLTEPEVAVAMGVSRGTVATTLHRARRALADSLASAEVEI
jgi:RNA polymerase sigma-70 factor (ECF subfamily)